MNGIICECQDVMIIMNTERSFHCLQQLIKFIQKFNFLSVALVFFCTLNHILLTDVVRRFHIEHAPFIYVAMYDRHVVATGTDTKSKRDDFKN
jgi:hypothetical protein